MRALALLLLLCALLVSLAAWQARETGPVALVLAACAGAVRLWRTDAPARP